MFIEVDRGAIINMWDAFECACACLCVREINKIKWGISAGGESKCPLNAHLLQAGLGATTTRGGK